MLIVYAAGNSEMSFYASLVFLLFSPGEKKQKKERSFLSLSETKCFLLSDPGLTWMFLLFIISRWVINLSSRLMFSRKMSPAILCESFTFTVFTPPKPLFSSLYFSVFVSAFPQDQSLPIVHSTSSGRKASICTETKKKHFHCQPVH